MTGDTSKKPQIDKFKDLAREVEADEDEAEFDRALRKLVGKPQDQRAKDTSERS